MENEAIIYQYKSSSLVLIYSICGLEKVKVDWVFWWVIFIRKKGVVV